ncbi:MAG TPA: hypothetical protein VM598_08490, partial [Bdellovibrionota bacterium]|nr:hypothetical protein [Bdellovibrionota bacterium]
RQPPQMRPPKPQAAFPQPAPKPQQPQQPKTGGDRRLQDRRTRERQEPDRRAVQERRSPLRPVTKPEPTRPPEAVRPERSQMTPIAYRPQEPSRRDSFQETFLQTIQDFRKPSNFQLAVAAAGLLLCLYLYNKIHRHRLVEIPEDPDRVATAPPDRAPGASVPQSMIKPVDDSEGRARFESAPEYKDYSVPPIDVAPGNSRVPKNDRGDN